MTTNHDIPRLVAHAGYGAISFAPIIGRGMSNEVTIVTTPGKRLVVRTNKASHISSFQKEAWCLDRMQEVGIPVPKVIACGVDGTTSYSIADYIECSGPIRPDHDTLRIWKTLGGHAAKLNSIPAIGYGWTMHTNGCFGSTWQELLDGELTLIFRDDLWERQPELSSGRAVKLRKILEQCHAIEAPSGICQFDLGCDNALIRNENYDEIFLLDLEQACAAPVPLYQLACVAKAIGHSSEIFEAFVEGYGLSKATRSEIAADLNRLIVLRHMRAVRWALERSPTNVGNFLRDTMSAISALLQNEL